MVKIGTDAKIKEVETIGRENAALLQKVADWCTHLEVNAFMSGMVAEQLQLPNRVSLNCQHASEPSDWIYLSVISKEFIEANCMDCPHHQVRREPNHGQVIIENYKLHQQEEAAAVRNRQLIAERIQQETTDLVLAGKKDASQTQLSILNLVAMLVEEGKRKEAAVKLCAAAKLDPVFFTDNAISALFMYFDDETCGGECIDATYFAMKGRGYYPNEGFELAKRIIGESNYFDKLARLVGLYLNDGNVKENHQLFDDLIDRLWYKRFAGEPAEPTRDFQNSEELLLQAGNRWPDELTTILRKHIAVNKKDKRINMNFLLHRLIDNLLDIVFSLTPELVASLDFDDDEYEQSADQITLGTLALIIKTDPPKGLAVIRKERAKLTKAGKAVLMKLNLLLIEDRVFTAHHFQVTEELVSELLTDIINKPVMAFKDDDLLHQLTFSVRERTDLFQDRYDGLLGYLAKLAEEEAVFEHYRREIEEKKPEEYTTFNYLVGMQWWDLTLLWQKIQSRYDDVSKIVGELCKDFPSQNLPKVFSLLTTLDSAKNEKLKLELLSLVMAYGRDPLTMVEFVPQFYTHLLDPVSKEIRYRSIDYLETVLDVFPMLLTSSIWNLFEVFIRDEDYVVKAKAIAVLGTIAVKYPERITEDHLKIVEDSLTNKYIIVHKNAVKILNRLLDMMDKPMQARIYIILLQLASVYKEEKDKRETFSMIIDRLMILLTNDNAMRFRIAERLVVPYAVGEDYYDSCKQINKLWRLGTETKEIRALWLQCCMAFLNTFAYHGASNDERPSIYGRMYELDRDYIIARQEEFYQFATIDGDASDRLYDVAQVLALFGYMEDYPFIIRLTEALAKQYPILNANERLLRIVRYWNLIAKSETESDASEKIKFNNDAANVF